MSLFVLLFLVFLSCHANAYLNVNKLGVVPSLRRSISSSSSKRLRMVDSALVQIAGGAVAGAVGVGVAYPFDSLKTKSQALVASGQDPLPVVPLIKKVLKDEGVGGFYGGVYGTMLGQGFIKSLAFTSQMQALSFWGVTQDTATLKQLIISAAVAGAVTSLVTNPVERIKIIMQADAGKYKNEFEAARAVLSKDGIVGFVFRGLEATLLREIPGYSFYFVVYTILLRSPLSVALGPLLGSLVSGAAAGMASWIPVYPFDVCKTFIQNCEGSGQGDLSSEVLDDSDFVFSNPENPSTLEVAMYLNSKFGPGVFFEGLNPKLIRAAVNHGVTFTVFQLVVDTWK